MKIECKYRRPKTKGNNQFSQMETINGIIRFCKREQLKYINGLWKIDTKIIGLVPIKGMIDLTTLLFYPVSFPKINNYSDYTTM